MIKKYLYILLMLCFFISTNAQDCPGVNDHPIFHLYDENQTSTTNKLDLYKQKNGFGSDFICPDTQCPIDFLGQLYKRTSITGSIDNLAYDDGKYYVINASGNLLFTDNIIAGNFIDLGNAQVGSGQKNLGYDNDVFYHWKSEGGNINLYSSTDPVSLGWNLMGTIKNRTVSYSASYNGAIGTHAYTYQLKDIAVDDGVFYFMYYANGSPQDYNYNDIRTRVFSSSNPTSSNPAWVDKGTTLFGDYVYNIAMGSQDLKALAPPVKDLVIPCANSTINLATAHTGTTPSGYSLRWFSNSNHTGTQLTSAQISSAAAGTYYAFYYNTSGTCYSPAAMVVVAKDSNCCPEPATYNYSTKQNGDWNSTSTWAGGVVPTGNNKNILITHNISYPSGSDFKPSSGTTVAIKDGGVLNAKQIQTDNGNTKFILNGGTINVTNGSFQITTSTSSVCSVNSCINIFNGDFQFEQSGTQMFFENTGIKVSNGNLQSKANVTGSDIRIWVKGNLQRNAGTWAGNSISAWYAGGSQSGFAGLPSQSSSSLMVCSIIAAPIVSGRVVTPTLNSTTGTQGGGLWMNVVRTSDNMVFAVVAIDALGNFSIPQGALQGGTNYNFILSKNAGYINTTNPITAVLNTGWATVAEGVNGTTPDGTPNSILNYTVGSLDVNTLRFAIKNCQAGTEQVSLNNNSLTN